MVVLKGDIVRTKSGDIGEIMESWGVARSFVRLKRDRDGRLIPLFESEIVEIVRRPTTRKTRKSS